MKVKIHDPVAIVPLVPTVAIVVIVAMVDDLKVETLRLVCCQLGAGLAIVLAGHVFGLFTVKGRD